MQLHIHENPEALSKAVADWLVKYVGEVLQRQERFTIALSGGSTPQALYDLLAKSPYRESIAWEKMHVFWGDERYVPFSDARNNARMAFDTLLQKVPIPAGQIHVMQTDVEPEASAAAYEKLLHTYFDANTTTFDLVLLGMGDDGHTLSLFPGTAVVHEEQAWVKAYYLDAQAMYRLTLTAPVVNRAGCVVFLVTGSKKAGVFKAVLKGYLNGPYQPELYPSQRIQPGNGNLIWFTDKAAVAEID
ncbi:MAG: 6-phosphogluconolactonase [Cytophagaceae bacterium]|nr:6-phosphogluconolactonase [Cytophagaceae bacterium]